MRGPNSSNIGFGNGSPDRRIKLEVGVIDEVFPEKGECRVITEKGRIIERARISQPIGTPEGFGLRVTPQANTRCLIALAETDGQRSIRPDDAYIVRTLRTKNVSGDSGNWGAPGDLMYDMPNAGQFLVSQSGVVDITSDPWARFSILPDEYRIKTKAKEFEKIYTPLAHERTVHDESAGEGFHEMFLNSAFLHRDGDKTPDIMWTLGTSNKTEKSHDLNPNTNFLHWFKTEERDDRGETTHRYMHMSGGVEGVISRRKAEDVENGAVFQEEIGNQDGLFQHSIAKTDEFKYDQQIGDQDNLFLDQIFSKKKVEHHRQIGKKTQKEGEIERTVIKTSDSEEVERRGLFGSRLYRRTWKKGGEKKFDIDLKDKGRMKITNPSWTVDIEEGKKATVDNGKTTFTIDGDKVNIDNETTTFTVEGDKITIDNGTTTLTIKGSQTTIDSGSTKLDVDASDIYVGGSSGSEPLVKGDTLKGILEQMKTWMNSHIHPHPVGPTSPPAAPFAGVFQPMLSKSNYVN